MLRSPPPQQRRLSRGGADAGGRHLRSKAWASARCGSAVGEVCFNTAMTGYQEILTDPSYAGQIVAFTFPHIGIVGTNDEDIEILTPGGARPDRARRCRASLQLSQPGGAGPLAEGAQHSGDGRHRHARADQPHPRTGHAARRDRAIAATARCDKAALLKQAKGVSRAGGPRPRQGGDFAPDVQLARDALGLEQRLWQRRQTPSSAPW